MDDSKSSYMDESIPSLAAKRDSSMPILQHLKEPRIRKVLYRDPSDTHQFRMRDSSLK